MRKFWVLTRPDPKADPVYIQREGEWLPAYIGLTWFMYYDTTHPRHRWYVVNKESGLSVLTGRNQREALVKFNAWLDQASVRQVRQIIENTNKKYGGPPDRRDQK